jgi:cell division septation protein DedD
VRALRLALAVFATLATSAAAGPAEEAGRLYERGDREGAGRILREWVASDPAASRSPSVVALLARTTEDPEEATGLWDQVLALSPGESLAAEARWMKGVQAYSAGRYVAAAREFEVLAKDFGSRFPKGRALLWKGCAELGADESVVAVETLRQAAKSAKDDDALAVEFALAHAAMRLGQVTDALRRYERFEREHRRDGRASAAARRAVECLRLLGREAEASARAAKIERDYPNSFEATLTREAVRKSGETAAPRPAAADEPARYVVQVAALTDAANAAKLAQQVRDLSLGNVSLEKGESSEGPVHRILLGPFDDESRARAAAERVAEISDDLVPRVREEPRR